MVTQIEHARRLFTVEEYGRMVEAGILSEDDRVELIDGEIIAMAPIGSQHAATVDGVANVLTTAAEKRGIVRTQGPISLGPYSEPQPDVTLLRPRAGGYFLAHPKPHDVLLIVEVAATSLHFDRDVKIPLYAHH